MMKEELIVVFTTQSFFVPIIESSFIDLCKFFDENDPYFLDVVVLDFMNSRTNEEQAMWMEVPLMNL
jgi:hypothetical protein